MASPLGRVETASVDLSADLQREAPGLEEHVWRPSERLNGLLADEYTLTVVSTRDEEGRRRFRPPNWESFAVLAAAGGLAFNQAQERYDRERVFAVRASLLLFQLQSRVGHGLARVFTRQKDLWTTSDGAGEAHVVPPDIRVASRPAHRSPSPDSISPTPADVLESGRELAREQGLERHDDATLIQLALDDAARRNPISVDEASDEELVRFVRLGLFELGPATEQVANEVYQEVIHRLLDSLEKHIELSTEAFNVWWFENVDNIVKQVSQRRRNTGPIDRRIVRQVVLEQIFDSYRHLAPVIADQMREFAAALDDPLTADESRIYTALYSRQRWLGGLCVPLRGKRPAVLFQEVLLFIESGVDSG